LNLNSLTKADLASHKNNPVVTLRRKLEAIAIKLNQLEAFERSARRDGRVHTIYRTLTGFGRFSSGGGNCSTRVDNDLPNLQSIGAKSDPILSEYDLPSLRKCIRPEPGKVMAVIDLAGAHGRIAADQAADPVAIAGNNDPSVDNHSKVAAYIASAQGFDWDWQQYCSVNRKLSVETAEEQGWVGEKGFPLSPLPSPAPLQPSPRNLTIPCSIGTGSTLKLPRKTKLIQTTSSLNPSGIQPKTLTTVGLTGQGQTAFKSRLQPILVKNHPSPIVKLLSKAVLRSIPKL